ncbi:MAG: tetratricopeptide repeat protein [Hormoscilla sp. SP5CHS1]|nr:tetratricopeptide repeat protein [Hormoscilla sp. SP12CHS1]MBC6452968.1 tetratricopeptide repeat protein [Hormoscilla sp. SP5CHS1]
MDSSLPIIYLSLFLSLLGVAAWFVLRQIFKTRKTESSLDELQMKLKSEKGSSEEYYQLGCIYSEKKMYAQSIKLFQQSLKIEKLPSQESALVYNALGFAYTAQEQYDLAIRHYKEAIKAVPDYVTALNNLGYTYEKKKLIAQAIEVYEEALKIEPNNATAKKRAESLRKRLAPSK